MISGNFRRLESGGVTFLIFLGDRQRRVTCGTAGYGFLAGSPITVNKVFTSYRVLHQTDGIDIWAR